MTYRVILATEAEDDIARLAKFLADKNPPAAARALRAIETAIATLDETPYRGRNTRWPDVKELPIPFNRRAYVARYEIDGDIVRVFAIRHSHEQARNRRR